MPLRMPPDASGPGALFRVPPSPSPEAAVSPPPSRACLLVSCCSQWWCGGDNCRSRIESAAAWATSAGARAAAAAVPAGTAAGPVTTPVSGVHRAMIRIGSCVAASVAERAAWARTTWKGGGGGRGRCAWEGEARAEGRMGADECGRTEHAGPAGCKHRRGMYRPTGEKDPWAHRGRSPHRCHYATPPPRARAGPITSKYLEAVSGLPSATRAKKSKLRRPWPRTGCSLVVRYSPDRGGGAVVPVSMPISSAARIR